MTETILAPFDAYRDVVRDAWIDRNGHLNMGYYVVVFDFATDAWLDYIGLDTERRRSQKIATFSLESHVTYAREVGKGDELRFASKPSSRVVKRSSSPFPTSRA